MSCFCLKWQIYKTIIVYQKKALKTVKSVRGSTAAGINISLLPRDCSCGEFACSAVWGRDLFSWHLCGICRWYYTGRGFFSPAFVGICRWCCLGERPFPWHFLAFGIFWHSAFLAFGIFGIRHIRYRRGPPVVRNMRAVLKKASYGTRRIFRGIRCKKQAFLVRE